MSQVETQLPPSHQQGPTATPSFRAQAAICNYITKKTADKRSPGPRRKLGVSLTPKQKNTEGPGEAKKDGGSEPQMCCGVYSAIDEAQSLETLFRASRVAFIWRTVVCSLFLALDGFYAYLAVLGVTKFPQNRFLRVLPIIYVLDTVVVVAFGYLMLVPPITKWKAWGAGVASGLRFVMSVGEILLLTFGLTELVTSCPGWYAVKLALEFVMLFVAGGFCALSFKVLEALCRIDAMQKPKPKSEASLA
mmetsp:Transcript_14649/g.41178  ORF Transcript_14649/g.41178 Transcript_14649/m.41178 type:complete len:248 (+) Transcript_14649:153-896(+)|eukprot:CAMPEP_0117651952 /NCGR_PEP_ID=MMETSP0804-20121206/2369_1 /TAXON_ID=1074897 /ORGANISM="Tetraselmis astigmatica, Strain CCMP880" /LENGTH=247 /DNA_ID=CAMNT_0005457969 /DNA_START=133 /DNA_END=876 /DNA_ORIENTATION=-